MKIKKKKKLEGISMCASKKKMELRELQAEINRTGANPITILNAKAYGTLDQIRWRGF